MRASTAKLILSALALVHVCLQFLTLNQKIQPINKALKHGINGTRNGTERDHHPSLITLYGAHRVSKSLSKLPKWLQEYVKWHTLQRRQVELQGNNYPIKYLVLHCFKNTKCGGIGKILS